MELRRKNDTHTVRMFLRMGFIYVLLLLGEPLSIKFASAQFSTPMVIATWNFVNATTAAYESLVVGGSSAIVAVVVGCGVCEKERCDGTVGYGGSPDENGESTLDAMIMDGLSMDAGAVANLRNIKNAIGVAYAVMKYTTHTMLVGSLATEFAHAMGFPEEDLSTDDSLRSWRNWKDGDCQPNYWKNVSPDPRESCGPYIPIGDHAKASLAVASNRQYHSSSLKWDKKQSANLWRNVGKYNHDTLGLIAIDQYGHIAGGTTTNGMRHKIPGRVGDSPIIGSGAYTDNEVGGAAATGDGDVMMRFLPSFHAVELMRTGLNPTVAAALSIGRITKFFPSFSGAVIAVKMDGEYGAACHNMPSGTFPFTIMSSLFNETQIVYVNCSSS